MLLVDRLDAYPAALRTLAPHLEVDVVARLEGYLGRFRHCTSCGRWHQATTAAHLLGHSNDRAGPRSFVDDLSMRGFAHLMTMRTDPVDGYAIEHLPQAPRDHVVYVAVRDGGPVYVGKAQDFRARYNSGHVRWLRGEKTTAPRQRLRWVEELGRGPVTFYGRRCDPSTLETEERRLIAELEPPLNVTHAPRRTR